MITKSSALLSVCLGLTVSTTSANNNELAIAMFKQSGQMNELAQCLSVSESQVEQSYRKTMDQCLKGGDLSFGELDPATERCFEVTFAKQLGVSESKLKSCESEEDKLQSDVDQIDEQIVELEQQIERLWNKENPSAADEQLMAQLEQKRDQLFMQQEKLQRKLEMASMSDEEREMERIMEQMGEEGPTEAQQRKLDQLHQQHIDNNVKEMQQQMNMMQQVSQNTVSQITLPIYQNSQVMMHITQGMSLEDGSGTTLPAATFTSSDAAQAVIDYYQKKLKGFKGKDLGDGMYIFMETMPEGFNVLSHMKEYTTTPHVLVRAIVSESEKSALPPNTQTMIEISYRR